MPVPFSPPRPASLVAVARRAKDPHPWLDVGELLLDPAAGRAVGGTEDELSAQVPFGRQTPCRVNFLREAFLVVLQVAAEAFGTKRGPDCERSWVSEWGGEREKGDTRAPL